MAVEQITYKNIDKKTRNMIMFGLAFAMLIACFDGTIVGTCAPKIAQTLSGSDLYSWMITAYLLCEAVMIPIAGKLSDLYGRKNLFLIGLTIFVVGSFLAGAAQNMIMFIACRAFQGLGGGILMPVATAAVADLYAPAERARMQGLLGAIFGIGSGIGPVLGGYIAQYITFAGIEGWRFCFYINIPFAIIAYVCTLKKFPAPMMLSKPIIDYKGITLLSVLVLDVLLLMELGGKDIAWVSLESAVMIVIAVVMVVLFAMVEKKATEPVLSPKLLKNKTVILACAFMFIFGIGMMGSMTYSSYFAITFITEGDTLLAGIYSIAMVVGMSLTAMSSGMLLNRTGYKVWLTAGPVITVVAMYLMSLMKTDVSVEYYLMCLFILGAGLGCMMGVIMTAVQNSCHEYEMGMSTSAVNLLRAIGCTMGTAIFATLLNNKLADLMTGLPADIPRNTGFLDHIMEYYVTYGPAVVNELMSDFCDAVDFSFLCGAVIVAIMVVIGIFFKVQTPEEVDAAIEKKE